MVVTGAVQNVAPAPHSTHLMSEMRELFIQNLDDTDSGINGKLSSFAAILARHDKPVSEKLVSAGVDPQFYALRWCTTLLARVFELPDSIRLWDCLFAEESGMSGMVLSCGGV